MADGGASADRSGCGRGSAPGTLPRAAGAAATVNGKPGLVLAGTQAPGVPRFGR